MKTLFTLLLCVFMLTAAANAQLDMLKRKANQQLEKKIDDALKDKPDDKKVDKKDEKKDVKQDDKKPADTKNEAGAADSKEISTLKPEFKSYSRFDFVPGDEIVLFDDFSQDKIGEFPELWNTDTKGEVVTINNYPGAWFQPAGGGSYLPDMKGELPENFTLEFDFIFKQIRKNWGRSFLLEIFNGQTGDFSEFRTGIKFTCRTNDIIYEGKINGAKTVGNLAPVSYLSDKLLTKVHFSLWVQKQKVRLYFDGVKVLDLPRMAPGLPMNKIRFNQHNGSDDNFLFYVSNLRVAVGAPDTRNKLLTEGKFVTRGIVFDSGSDNIKPESVGVLKQIADVLVQNPQLKIKIIGHTDSDGKADANLDLSKRRAESVKNELVNSFKVDASMIETDGMGASQPVSPNTTSEGKANNRRVEFIKM